MEQFEPAPVDLAIIRMMLRIREKYHKNSEDSTNICMLLEEKIIYTSLICYEKLGQHQKQGLNQQLQELNTLIVHFVQKINKLAMENYEKPSDQNSKTHQKFINKCISILMISELDKYVKDAHLLSKLKILSFNNLSCIYKKKKKYGIALRSINQALELQENLLKSNNNEEKYDIIPTYLNKAAIYSEMKKHPQAIEMILKAKIHIESIESELLKQIEDTNEQLQKQRLVEKRYYGLYMKMIILYNMGAEKEHLRLRQEALEYYKQSKQTAVIISNQLMIDKLTNVIASLMEELR